MAAAARMPGCASLAALAVGDAWCVLRPLGLTKAGAHEAADLVLQLGKVAPHNALPQPDVLSPLAEARVRPSGLNATLLTTSVWP